MVSSAMADMVDYSLLHQNQNVAEEDELNDRVTAGGVNLPSELIYEIVCRLPAKSVGRFRCVSKEWRILLSSLQFIKNQFNFNNRQTKMIFCRNETYFSINFRSDCTDNEGHPFAISEALSFKTANFAIRGSCNGLILLYDFRKHDLRKSALSIVNPITHKVLQLPVMPRNIDRFPVFGFGYCLNDDEYTVVIAKDATPLSPVYMLKNNLWKRVEDSPVSLHYFGFFVGGSIHWLGYRYFDKSFVVCAFDLASERFREVEKPEGLKKNVEFGLNVLDGCLCLIVYHGDAATDIWVMKKYGLRDSWTKYTFEFNLLPLFFWNCDEYIVAKIGGRLIICCLKQKTSAIIPIRELSPEFRYDEMWPFVDSLFSLDSSNTLEGSNQVHV